MSYKLKILHRFLISLLTNNQWGILIIPLLFPTLLQAQQTPGLIESLNSLTNVIQKDKTKILNDLKKKERNRINAQDYALADLFLKEVLTYTPTRFLVLAKKDECSLYDLYLAGLLRDSKGVIEEVLVQNIKTKKYEHVSKKAFIEYFLSSKCPKSTKLEQYFNWPAIKETAKTISFTSPTVVNQCIELHDQYLNDVRMPHLCGLDYNIRSILGLKREIDRTPKRNFEKIKQLQLKVLKYSKMKSLFKPSALQYLNQLCDYLDSPMNFCSQFFSQNYWMKIINKEKDPTPLKLQCKGILNKKKMTENRLKKCASIMEREPDICSFNSNSAQSLAPWPNCNDLSTALNHSRLYNMYEDCPGKVGNEGIISLSRIISHKNRSMPIGKKSCSTAHAANFVNFNIPASETRNWKNLACFQNKIQGREECYPTLFSNSTNSRYSLESTIAKILTKTRGTKPSLKCEVILEKDYKPTLLKYKAGCFVISQESCNEVRCNPKIILDQVEMKHIYFKSGIRLDYDAGRVQEEKHAQINLIRESSIWKNKRILNLTLLQNFFKEHTKALAHGVGCAHELLPEFFRYKRLGTCQPLSFVISGLMTEDGLTSVIIHTGADNIQAPRILSWSRIVNALSTYQQFHPLNQWSLYGVY
jgi:hypothetical protein